MVARARRDSAPARLDFVLPPPRESASLADFDLDRLTLSPWFSLCVRRAERRAREREGELVWRGQVYSDHSVTSVIAGVNVVEEEDEVGMCWQCVFFFGWCYSRLRRARMARNSLVTQAHIRAHAFICIYALAGPEVWCAHAPREHTPPYAWQVCSYALSLSLCQQLLLDWTAGLPCALVRLGLAGNGKQGAGLM